MGYDFIAVTEADGVTTITLDRPGVMNALNRSLRRELTVALRLGHRGRVIVLTGAGRAFCSGQDLTDADGLDAAGFEATLNEEYVPMIRAITEAPVPVIAAVNGAAAGAGANLALACDLVIAAKSASFLQAFVNIGLVPDSGGTFFLPQRVGVARAMGLAMLGEKTGAEQAAQWGLIWRCVDDDRLDAEVDVLATRLAAMPTRALAAIKQAIHAASGNGLDAQLDLERDLQSQLGASHDYAEGVNAFLQKRAPRFEGR